MDKKVLHPEASSLVSASAGTGKTWLLVSRILRLLLEGEKSDSILAITFTNKAAGEMQERLMQRLLELSFAQSTQVQQLQELGIEPDAKYRKQVDYLYENTLHADYPVRVTTFHSFCQHIIAMFPTSKLPLNFQILANNRGYTSQACDRLFEEASQDPKGEIAQNLSCLFNECNGIANARTALSSFLDHRNDWLAYRTSGNPEKKLLGILGIEKIDAPILEMFWQDAIREKLQRYADLREKSISSNKAVKDKINAIRKILSQPSLDPDTFEQLSAQIHNTKGAREFKPKKTMQKFLSDEKIGELDQLSSEISNAIQTANEKLRKQANYHLNTAWYRLGDALLDIYQQLKFENNLADFNDLEWTAKEILSRDENSGKQLQQRLSNRIKHVLIDEFQDTNPIQWELIRPLLDEIASQQEGSIFIVGDVKQSIYGFRGADPSLQGVAGNWLVENMQGSQSTIEKSYRSAQTIINFVNNVFVNSTDATRLDSFISHKTFQKTKGGVHIFDLLGSDADDAEQDKEAKPLRYMRPEQAWRNPLRTPLETVQNTTEQEAEQVAQTIFAMKQSGFPIDEEGSDRPFAYRDALILARYKTKFPFFKTALRKYGIPFAGADDINPFQSFEVHDVCTLLRFLHDPQRNDLLARILRSPLFAFSSEDLFKLAKRARKFWFYELPNGSERWQEAHRLLNDFIRLYGRLPTHDLLDHIYDQTDIVSRYLSASDPSRHLLIRENLDALLDQALEYKSGRYPDTLDFVDYIQLQQSEEGKDASNTSEGCVRMMSIHAAKGLEAPVVFLVDTQAPRKARDTYKAQFSWQSGTDENRAFVLFSPDKGRSVGIKSIDSQIRQREQREEANLLYVALTRAKQYLLISDSLSQISEGSWYQISKEAHDKLKDNPAFLPSIEMPDPHTIERASDQTEAVSPILKMPPPAIPKAINPSTVHAKVSPVIRSSDSAVHKAYGNIFHRALELLCDAPADNDQQIKEQICDEYPEYTEQIDGWFLEASELYRSEQFKELFDNSRYTHTYNELPILYRNQNGEQVSGIIDRLCVDAKSAWIVDYKTHRVEQDKINALAKTFESQIQLYQSSVEKLFPNRQLRASVLFTSARILYDYRF